MLALRLGRLLLKALLPNCCPTVQTLIIVVITIISTCISRQRLGLGRCLEYQRLVCCRGGLPGPWGSLGAAGRAPAAGRLVVTLAGG